LGKVHWLTWPIESALAFGALIANERPNPGQLGDSERRFQSRMLTGVWAPPSDERQPVYPICLAFSRSRSAVPLKEQLLLCGGLRPPWRYPLALPGDLPLRGDILIVAFAVVASS
jgi:hypothetical protein